MFVRGSRRVYNSGGQVASGDLLILLSPDDRPFAMRETRAVVRYVRLTQVGHFMMGSVTFRGGGKTHRLTLSGTYGADGLTANVPVWVWEMGVQIPDNVIDGGNISFSDLRKWARDTFPPTPALKRYRGGRR